MLSFTSATKLKVPSIFRIKAVLFEERADNLQPWGLVVVQARKICSLSGGTELSMQVVECLSNPSGRKSAILRLKGGNLEVR